MTGREEGIVLSALSGFMYLSTGKSCLLSEGQCYCVLYSTLKIQVQANHESERISFDVPYVVGDHATIKTGFLKVWMKNAFITLDICTRHLSQHMELLDSWYLSSCRVGAGLACHAAFICCTWTVLRPIHKCRLLLLSLFLITFWPWSDQSDII